MRGAALSSLLIKPSHRMARPPCRHMHRAGAWINPYKPRQGSQCSSCHTTCLVFRAHSLGGCHQQLAVTASGWWMVYYTASITLIHSSGASEGKENQQFSNITITKERVMRNKKKSHEI